MAAAATQRSFIVSPCPFPKEKCPPSRAAARKGRGKQNSRISIRQGGIRGPPQAQKKRIGVFHRIGEAGAFHPGIPFRYTDFHTVPARTLFPWGFPERRKVCEGKELMSSCRCSSPSLLSWEGAR